MKREKKWIDYHKCENEQKKRFLRGSTKQDSINLLRELYTRAYWLSAGRKSTAPDIFTKEKIRTLSKIHSTFSKVRT